MTTYPNMGLVLPTRGAPGAGVWGDTEDSNTAKLDAHDHSAGKGTPVNTDGIVIDADLSFASLYAPTNLHRITFASIVALSSSNKSLFVSTADNELYWRTNAGTNVKLTSGAALNVAAFTGGIGGDYAAAGAAVAFDDSAKRYTFKDGAGNWARNVSGGVRLIQLGTTESVYVGLIAPVALAASYDVTLPLALPSSLATVQMDSAGVLTASPGHGDRVLSLSSFSGVPTPVANISQPFNTPGMLAIGAVDLYMNIPLLAGDRIKSIAVNLLGNAPNTADIIIALRRQEADGTGTIMSTTTVLNCPAAWTVTTLAAINQTIVAGEFYLLLFNINAAGILIGSVAVTYDRLLT